MRVCPSMPPVDDYTPNQFREVAAGARSFRWYPEGHVQCWARRDCVRLQSTKKNGLRAPLSLACVHPGTKGREVLSFDTGPGEVAEPNNLACGRCFCLITTYSRTNPVASHVVSVPLFESLMWNAHY